MQLFLLYLLSCLVPIAIATASDNGNKMNHCNSEAHRSPAVICMQCFRYTNVWNP